MKQIKPKVIGYIQIGYLGIPFMSTVPNKHRAVCYKDEMYALSEQDFNQWQIKSKFRPVYAK